MTRTPTVTVLIPTFNRGDFLAECLDSIQSQTLPPSQIIVVNDGSTDHTLEVLKPYRDRIEYIETPQLGKPAALNAGLERVTGDYLWIFDDDDVALPEALARFVEPLENHPEHGFSYSTYYYTASRPEDNRIGSILDESRIPDVHERGFLIPLLEGNFLGGAALFARTSCYARVGNFDTRLVRSQDYEMAIRIARRFSGIRVPGGATFHYRQHEGLRGSTRDRFQVGTRFQQVAPIRSDDLSRSLPPDAAGRVPAARSLTGRRTPAGPFAASGHPGLQASDARRSQTELGVIARIAESVSPVGPGTADCPRTLIFHRPYYMQGSINDHLNSSTRSVAWRSPRR